MSVSYFRIALILAALTVAAYCHAQEGVNDKLPNKAGWHVVHDPGESFKGPFNLKGSITIPVQGRYVFPSTPGAFVAVSAPKIKNVYQVYDLRTLKPVGVPITITDPYDVFTVPRLAPDGKHLSARVKVGADSTIEVWSVATGKSVRRLPIEADKEIKPKYNDLLGKGRLWVAKHKSEFPKFTALTMFQVYDIDTGKEISRFTNPLVPDGKWFTFSAGQRYQWMEQTGGWFLHLVWDMHTGKMIGEREFQGQKDTWGIAAGMAFSPDGEEMAMLWQDKDRERNKCFGRLLCWETTTGKKLYDHTLNAAFPQMAYLATNGGTRSLQWWPERKGWLLFGHLLVDRDSGAVVHTIGKAPAFEGAIESRRFLDAYHITNVEGALNKQLKVIALPRAQIEAAVKKARADVK